MAKEITTNITANIISKGGSKASGSVATTEDLSGPFYGFQVTAGTAAAAVALGVASPKIVFIQNIDPTHDVQVDNVIGMTGWPQTISAGEGVLLRPANGTLYAKATTAPVAIWIVAG